MTTLPSRGQICFSLFVLVGKNVQLRRLEENVQLHLHCVCCSLHLHAPCHPPLLVCFPQLLLFNATAMTCTATQL